MTEAAEDLQKLVNSAAPVLLAIGESAAAEKPYSDKWSRKEILGHLIDSAANNHQRIVRMQETKDIGTFRYSQQHWVGAQHYQAEAWEHLVDLWRSYNLHLAHVIGHVDKGALEHVCDMGYAKPATLRFVIEDYLRHVRHHVEQIQASVDPRQREQWVRRDPG